MSEERTTRLWAFSAGNKEHAEMVERLHDLPAGSVCVRSVCHDQVRWCLREEDELEEEEKESSKEEEEEEEPEGWTLQSLHNPLRVPDNRVLVPVGTWGMGEGHEVFVQITVKEGRGEGRTVRLMSRAHPLVQKGQIEVSRAVREALGATQGCRVEVKQAVLPDPVPVARRVTCLSSPAVPTLGNQPDIATEEGLRELARKEPYWTCFTPMFMEVQGPGHREKLYSVVAMDWEGDGDADSIFCCDEATVFVNK